MHAGLVRGGRVSIANNGTSNVMQKLSIRQKDVLAGGMSNILPNICILCSSQRGQRDEKLILFANANVDTRLLMEAV